MKRLDDVKYTYQNLPVPGGGFVTGFVFHPKEHNILYARTDVGGIYRFDRSSDRWQSLSDKLTEFDRHLAQPLSIAVDCDKAEMLYAMCGNSSKRYARGSAALMISHDKGESFVVKSVPFHCNGNAPARSSAERLSVKNGRIYFGSQEEGLWCSCNDGDSWERLPFPEENIVFVYTHPEYDIMLIACTGEANANGTDRASTLYVSYDNGSTFAPLPQPEALDDCRCCHNGFVPCAIACCDDRILISFSHSFKGGWGGWNSFACDNGGGFDGRLFCYTIADGIVSFQKDITPKLRGFSDENQRRKLPFGLGGIDFFGDTIALCSVGGHGDAVFISKDFGDSYDIIKSTDLERFEIDVPYLKPEYNGGRVPLHWTSCMRIDPFDPDLAVINTGTGVFALCALTTDRPFIKSMTYGIEETVHMNIYGLPKGKNQVLDLVGDLGGFAFSDVDRPCENSFADENAHRYITCLNADFVPDDPDIFITTARGNWTGHTKGGVIITSDGGESFSHIGYPIGLSAVLDEMSDIITRPNTNSGWAAISADGEIICWTLAYQWMQLPCFGAVRYDREAHQFTKISITDISGNDISCSDAHIKIFSDRTDPGTFYGFGEKGQLYLSRDKGQSFVQLQAESFPECRMSGIDGGKGCEIRFHPSLRGVCYAALLNEGLWRLEFSGDHVLTKRITENGVFVKTVGFGAGNSADSPALYVSGTLFGEYGFWRSFDDGASWERINSDSQMYGGIVSMDGDMRKRGRVYIASGGRGGFYGEECTD